MGDVVEMYPFRGVDLFTHHELVDHLFALLVIVERDP